MKSIIKLKITGVDYYTGKKVTIKRELECPDIHFVDEKVEAHSMMVNGKPLLIEERIIPAFQLADAHVENQHDFLKDVIHDPAKELSHILTWEVISIENIGGEVYKELAVITKPKTEKVSEEDKMSMFLSIYEEKTGVVSDDFRNGLIHTFMEIKDSLKGLSFEKKFLITMQAMGVGLKASSVAYRHMTNILKDGMKNPKYIEYRDKKMSPELKHKQSFLEE